MTFMDGAMVEKQNLNDVKLLEINVVSKIISNKLIHKWLEFKFPFKRSFEQPRVLIIVKSISIQSLFQWKIF